MNGTITRGVSLPQTDLTPVVEAPGWDLRLLLPTVALLAFGVAMVYSAAIPITTREGTSGLLIYLIKELIFLVLGIVAMVAAARLSLARLHDRALALFVVTLVLLAGVHVLGKEVNGAKSWYNLPIPKLNLSFQPSEMAKVVLVIAFARYFAKFPQGLRSLKQMLPPLVMLGLVCGMVAKEPDMGTVAVIGLSMLIFFHLAGAKLRYLVVVAGFAALVAGVKIVHEPYQLMRIMDWLHPSAQAEMAGNYQISRSLIALGSGGLFGRGYCGSVEKFFYLPEATTDAILAVIGEELGFLATATVLVLLAYLVRRGLQLAASADDRFSGLVAAGVTCLFGVQSLLNVAVITGMVPTTGITLPFVSYGGSSLLFSLVEIGLLMNVARAKRVPKAARAGR